MRTAERSRHAFTSLASARLLCGRCIQLSEVSEIQHHPHQVRSFAVEYPNPSAAADVPRGRALAMRSLAQPRASAAFSQVFSSAQAVCSGSDQPCRAAVLHDCAAAQQPPFAAAAPVTPSQAAASTAIQTRAGGPFGFAADAVRARYGRSCVGAALRFRGRDASVDGW